MGAHRLPRIRENRLVGGRYLRRDGSWGRWEEAARFASPQALERFAERHLGKQPCGVFERRSCLDGG